jgi:hypothetical protein
MVPSRHTAMAIESFVDVTYKNLEVGRRVKLADVAPESGYLELPAPMPVGTTVELACGDGIALIATVRMVHEQVAGSDRPPGMRVVPKLTSDAERAWWAARISTTGIPAPIVTPGERITQPRVATKLGIMENAVPLAEIRKRTHEMTAEEVEQTRAAAERVRRETGDQPLDEKRPTRSLMVGEVEAAVSSAESAARSLGMAGRGGANTPGDGIPLPDADGLVDDGKKTEIMEAVDPETLARLTGANDPLLIDDGRRTMVMESMSFDDNTQPNTAPAIETAADGDDGNGNGDDDGDDNGDDPGVSGDQLPSASGSMQAQGKRHRRRKRKRR